MEKTEKVIRTLCDFCGESSYNKCLSCGKDICYRCAREGILAKTFSHAVHFSGSEDGIYCGACNQNLTADPKLDALHVAYRKVEALRAEYKLWEKDFYERAKNAEEIVKTLRKARGL